jgi:hypothetical protein
MKFSGDDNGIERQWIAEKIVNHGARCNERDGIDAIFSITS